MRIKWFVTAAYMLFYAIRLFSRVCSESKIGHMYKCIVEKHILDDDISRNTYTALCYEVDVAQAPEIGDELRDERWFSGPLVKVIWDIGVNCFYARVADERPYIQGSIDFNHDWMVQNYLQQGWIVCSQSIDKKNN